MQITLSHPAYTTPLKVRGWNGRLHAGNTTSLTHSATVIKRLMPGWTKEDHAAIADYHARRANKMQAAWNLIVERAALQTFGRPWQFTDYKVCAIARDEFSEAHKRVLRHCAYNGNRHLHLARVHHRLAGQRTKVSQV